MLAIMCRRIFCLSAYRPKKIKIKIHRIIILPVVWMGVKLGLLHQDRNIH